MHDGTLSLTSANNDADFNCLFVMSDITRFQDSHLTSPTVNGLFFHIAY
jgi:hypothetical protein